MIRPFSNQLRRNLILNNAFLPLARSISVSAPRPVKDIIEHRDGKTLTIEAVKRPSDRQHRLYKPKDRNNACPLCALGLDVKHTDVLILEQFITPKGSLLPSRITGLCSWQQRKMSFMVAMALQAGLFPTYGAASAKLASHWVAHFRKYNSYYDENTIRTSKKAWKDKKDKELAQAIDLALAEIEGK